MRDLDRFGKSELTVVRSQLAEAESLLSRYYCVREREWPHYPYEVKTLAELREPEITEGAFALVAKYEYLLGSQGKKGGRQGRIEIYGICLQDHNILTAAHRHSDGIAFESLMLYILTHELVHVFRFANAPQSFFMEKPLRQSEESRVHRITSSILQGRKDPKLLRVLDLYRDYPSFPHSLS
jgi:hypothetical protein